MAYRRILLGIDLRGQSELVARRAIEVAQATGASLTLLHVVEFIPVDPAGEALLPPPVNLEEELVASARQRLETLATSIGLGDADRRIEIGTIKHEILRVAQEIDADLIMLGSYERHGLALLLGTTEKSVLNAAPCDVLAVRLNPNT
ncbi:MAG: universal stress protein [Xanthomonadaceae bacterium]|nr:universal stress protein [Xanthomonadaceae bacterium]